MTRLTKDIREKMATALLKHRFKDEGTALAAQSGLLFEKVYEDTHDKETRSLMEKLLKRHPGIFTNNNNVLCRMQGGYHFSVGSTTIGLPPVTFKNNNLSRPFLDQSYKRFSFDSGALCDELVKLAEDCDNFSERIKRASLEIMAALNQISSVRQLISQWPEVMPLVSHLIPQERAGLPAIQFSKINKEFGLPPAEQAAL